MARLSDNVKITNGKSITDGVLDSDARFARDTQNVHSTKTLFDNTRAPSAKGKPQVHQPTRAWGMKTHPGTPAQSAASAASSPLYKKILNKQRVTATAIGVVAGEMEESEFLEAYGKPLTKANQARNAVYTAKRFKEWRAKRENRLTSKVVSKGETPTPPGAQQISRKATVNGRAVNLTGRLTKDATLRTTTRKVPMSAVRNSPAMTQMRRQATRAVVEYNKTATVARGLGSGAKGVEILKGVTGVAVKGGTKGFFGAILGAAAPYILAVLGIAMALFIVVSAFTAIIGSHNPNIQGLNETEQAVYQFFKDKGVDDIQIAGIMGNMYAESGMRPDAVEPSPGTGIGLCQWSFGRADALRNYAAKEKTEWDDLNTQLEFFWEHDEYHTNWSGSYSNDIDGITMYVTKAMFLAAKTPEDAAMYFCVGWERPGNPRFNVRTEAARRYYDAITATTGAGHGTGEEYDKSTSRQKHVVDVAYSTGFPGKGLCATYTSDVFENAGYGRYGGNANDQWRSWCNLSDTNKLKVGMIIAVEHAPGDEGYTYGHVGIYVGDNKVRNSLNTAVQDDDLNAWIDHYGSHGKYPVKFGWMGGIDLTK